MPDGAFAGNARTELIEGEIWVVNSVHRWRARVMAQIHLALVAAIRDAGLDLEVLLAGSVWMGNFSVPEPDLSVIPISDEDDRAIGLQELKLAIEISDSTLRADLGRKATLYASHNVPEYWVIDRDGAQVIQHLDPAGDVYATVRKIAFGEDVAAATIPGLRVPTITLR